MELLIFSYYNSKLWLMPHNVKLRIKRNLLWHFSILLVPSCRYEASNEKQQVHELEISKFSFFMNIPISDYFISSFVTKRMFLPHLRKWTLAQTHFIILPTIWTWPLARLIIFLLGRTLPTLDLDQCFPNGGPPPTPEGRTEWVLRRAWVNKIRINIILYSAEMLNFCSFINHLRHAVA
jgi:hypothetical protein